MAGLLIIGLGAYILFAFEYFDTAAFVIIALGIVIVLASLFGTLGAVRESSRMNKTFVAILVLLIVLHVLSVGFFWFFQQSLLINVDQTFDKLWGDQQVPIKPGNVSQIANVERWLDCCGNAGSTDYILPPNSCYNSETNKLNIDGCRQKFLDYIAERWTVFTIIALVLIGIELICALFSYVLANSIVNRWRRSKYFPK
ncbi:Tsp42Eg [Drosophila busckii]|uniref:Tsp42Eg n=1 Tax=Drosophila busckii TaxID=30019 RepID=A0A0M4E513_DROBS|nr:Tsp42Eg [Drosophila busckii]